MNRANEHSRQGQLAVNPALPRLRVSGLWTVLAILVALIGALSATLPLLTSFANYDDEGYMLLSLTHYIKEGHLYTQTFSQYGPFYFYAQGIFFQLLHLPVTHDIGRLVTLFYWVASSLLATVWVYRLSKSTFLACAAGLCSMLSGKALTSEPGHPQQVVLLLFMIAACLSLPSRRKYSHLFLLGCVGAALIFTKVNVGLFYIAGLAHALICVLPSGRIRSIGLGLTLIYAAAVPWLLMHKSFNLGFRDYCLLATLSGVATFACGSLVQPHDRLSMRAAVCGGAGLLTGTALIIVATSLQGVSIGSLVFGVILNPVRQANIFYYPLDVTLMNLLAAVALTAGVVNMSLSGRLLAESWWLDVVKCAVGIAAIYLLVRQDQIQWVVLLLPLALIPRSNWDHNALFSRSFITCMAATQFLEPYPVAASQVGIAAAPMLLWAFVCIADGIAGLRASARTPFQFPAAWLWLDAMIGGTILVAFAALSVVHLAHSQFPPASTGLRGSEWLHLPAAQATELESISRNVETNCSTLFTMPGMGSFNIWSGVPTPNGWNLTAWMRGISSERQAEILGIMKADPRGCAILNRRALLFWETDEAGLAALPLAHYVMIDMPKIAEFGQYEIRVNPRRSSPWPQSP